MSNQIATATNAGQVTVGFGSASSFELMQRAAKLLSSSTLVPASYRAYDEKKGDNPAAMANCVVALNMSQRMGADPLMVMQNLYIVEGRPSWSSQWIIAAINGCGRFSPLRFAITELGTKEVEYSVTEWVDRQRVNKKMKATVQNMECIAWAIEKETGERIDSPKVSIEMAVKEGWYGKNGSKWQTMPEVMLRYRTASFFGKLYAPELLMGIQSAEEAHDIVDVDAYEPMPETRRKPTVTMPVEITPMPEPASHTVDQDTGEILPAEANPEPKPDPDPKAAPAEPRASNSALASEGERKMIVTRAKNNGLDLRAMLEQTGMAELPDDLAGLTKDGWLSLRDLLPKVSI